MSSDNKRRRFRSLVHSCGPMCAYCGSMSELTLDHILPKSLGGADALLNLQLLCYPCNQAKANTGAGKSTVLRWRGLVAA